jgi:hypothetical protein
MAVSPSQSACQICQATDQVRTKQLRPPVALCDRCKKLAMRRFNTRRGRQRDRVVETPSRHEWIAILQKSWDRNDRCFRCMVSGVELLIDKPESARYPTLEHSAPGTGQSGWLVVAAAINDMKSDFAMDEFRAVVPLLARALLTGGDRSASEELQRIFDHLRHFRRIKTLGKEAKGSFKG